MSNPIEGGHRPPENETARPELTRLTREEVIERLKNQENFENCRLVDLKLGGGLNFEKRSFRGSDVRGLVLYDEMQEKRTNIRETDWLDAQIGDFGDETFFAYADAEGATFGFSETLAARRERQRADLEAGRKIPAADSGAYLNFNFQQAKGARTRWRNVDFGGAYDSYESRFQGADLKAATFDGCNHANIDWTECKVDGVILEDPESLEGLRLTAEQVEAVASGIRYSDPQTQSEFQEALRNQGARRLLEEAFGAVIVEEE